MFSKMNFCCALLVLGLLNTVLAAETKCKTCMDNYAYCVDERNYHLCFGSNPSSTLLSCAENEVCTSSAEVCVAKTEATAIPVCESPCAKCGTLPFTCVSTTQFGRCVNNAATAISSCDAGQVCSMDLFTDTGHLCAPACVMDFFGYESTCTNDIVTTTTTTVAPAPTPSVANLEEQCLAAEASATSFYYFIPNTVDPNCLTYIYCEKVGDVMEAYLFTCKPGLYYDEVAKKCVDKQPENCPRPSVSTTTTTSATTATTTTTNSEPELTSTTPGENGGSEGTTDPTPTTTEGPISTTTTDTISTTTIDPISTTTIDPISTTTIDPMSTTTIDPISTTTTIEEVRDVPTTTKAPWGFTEE